MNDNGGLCFWLRNEYDTLLYDFGITYNAFESNICAALLSKRFRSHS